MIDNYKNFKIVSGGLQILNLLPSKKSGLCIHIGYLFKKLIIIFLFLISIELFL